MKLLFIFFSFFLFSFLPAHSTEPLRFASGPARVSLIELYTSEGCSSCPPADRWLAALRTDPGLWRDFVPVAFHVNYWDKLGWTDRFSSRAFTQREYDYAAAWGANSVYTPCFVRDGAEWHPGPGGPSAPAGTPGILTVQIAGGPNETLGRSATTIQVQFAPGANSRPASFTAHAALLRGGFASKVTSGENRGETLKHEFVALVFLEQDLSPMTSNNIQQAELTLASPAVRDAPREAVAVWITRRGNLVPIQAAGGWLN